MLIDFLKVDINSLIFLSLVLFAVSLCYQLFVNLYVYTRPFAAHKKAKTIGSYPPVTVIICAKNEEENLKQNLPKILNQDYPNFEVFVVNDASSDGSSLLLANFKKEFAHFNYTDIEENEDFYHGKKLGLTLGIKAAKNDLLLFIDADCYPKTAHWIKEMIDKFSTEKDIVLGYGGYEKRGGFLNKLIQFDTLQIAQQYLSYAVLKNPYMGVGRNLAYRKSFFIEKKGFANHSHILAGDDDLFVNEMANSKNTEICLSNDSQTLSAPKTSFSDWFNQKRRHLSTGKYYKFKHKIILGAEILSRFIFYTTFVILLLIPQYLIITSTAFIIRHLIKMLIEYKYAKLFGIKKILFFSPIFDILIPLINLYLLFTLYLSRRNIKWN